MTRKPKPSLQLTRRFEQALIFATRKHAGQIRKGTGTPYISHLLSVAALVLEAGGNEDLAIAALLHDVVEDCGGAPMLKEVHRRFGKRRLSRMWGTNLATVSRQTGGHALVLSGLAGRVSAQVWEPMGR